MNIAKQMDYSKYKYRIGAYSRYKYRTGGLFKMYKSNIVKSLMKPQRIYCLHVRLPKYEKKYSINFQDLNK